MCVIENPKVYKTSLPKFNFNRLFRLGRRSLTSTRTVTDPHVISAYLKKRRQIDAAALSTQEKMPTSQIEIDDRKQRYVQEELARLKRNRDRRLARKKRMSINSASGLGMGPPTPLGETPPSSGSPASVAPPKVKVATFVSVLFFYVLLSLVEEMLGLWSGWSCQDE